MKTTAPKQRQPQKPVSPNLTRSHTIFPHTVFPHTVTPRPGHDFSGMPVPLPAAREAIAPPLVGEVLRSPGQPLDPAVRALLGPRFGHDFSRVRVHTDARAAESAQAVNASAYTVGDHIVFQKGQYEPQTAHGRGLLSHELAHVVQAGGNAPQSAPRLSSPSSTAERIAETAGRKAAAGERVGALEPASPGLYRKPMGIPDIKKAIAAKGHDDVSELANLIPASGNGAAKFKEVVIGTTKHLIFLETKLVVQSSFVTQMSGANAVTQEIVTTSGTPPSQVVTHTVRMTFPSNMVGDIVETVYHELVHARILIDKTLPVESRSDTGRRYSQLVEMASDDALLLVTGTKAKKDAVIQAIQNLRAGISSVAGFNPKSLGPATTDGAIYEFLINEKFTNTESSTVAGPKPLAADVIARRYASSLRNTLEGGIEGAARTSYLGSKIADLVGERETALRDALVQLYRALDEQLKIIADAKKSGLPGAVKNPKPSSSPEPAEPLDISGNPVRPKSP